MKTDNGLEGFLQKVRGGKTPLGGVVTFTDPAVTEVLCSAGFDFIWVDGEHGIIDRKTAQDHVVAAAARGVPAFYRVPACNHTEIKRIIDLDPAGVIVPMVMNAEDAATAVAACRYPVHGGNRGCGYRRGFAYGAADAQAYLDDAKENPLVIIQLEHIDAIRDLDRLLAVPGVGSFLIGPYDLTMSMGKPGAWHDPEVMAVFDETCRKVKAAGALLGVYCECDFDLWKRRGVDYMAIKNDTNAMLEGARAMMAKAVAARAE